MGSSLAPILQTQITAITALMASVSPVSVNSDGVTYTNQRWTELSDQLLKLQMLYDRVSGNQPMIVRGRVKGLGRGYGDGDTSSGVNNGG